jgi:hypothetical protein
MSKKGKETKESNTNIKPENNLNLSFTTGTVANLPPIQESNTNTYPTSHVYETRSTATGNSNPTIANYNPSNAHASSIPTSTIPVKFIADQNSPPNSNQYSSNSNSEESLGYEGATEDILNYITKNAELRKELVEALVGSAAVKPSASISEESGAKFARPTLKAPSVYSGEYLTAGNPNASEVNADEWLEEMENYMSLNSYSLRSDKDKLDFARTYLSGAALAFFKMWRDHPPPIDIDIDSQAPKLETGFNTWEGFRNKLKRNFQPLNNPQYVRDQMKSIIQGNKTVAHYVAAFRLVMVRLPKMDNEEKVWHFREGLHSGIKAYVDDKILDLNKGPLLSLDDVIQIALTREAHLLHQLQRNGMNVHYNPNTSTRGSIGSANANNYNQQYKNNRGGYNNYPWGRGRGYNVNYYKSQYTNSNSKAKVQLNNINNLDTHQNAYNALGQGYGEETEEQEVKQETESEQEEARLYAAVTSASNSSSSSSSASMSSGSNASSFIPGPCYTCGKMGHISKDCWSNPINSGASGRGNYNQRGRGRGGFRGWGRGRNQVNGRGGNQGKV